MTPNAFNIAASPAPDSQPYVFDFDREVAAFYRDHPALKKTLLFIDASASPGGAICRRDEGDEDEIIGLRAGNGRLYTAAKETHETGKAGAVRYEDYDCVILKTPRNRHDV